MQGVSVESQLVWKSYAPTNSPWSRETSLLRNSITRAALTFAISSKNRVSKVNFWIKSRYFLRKMIGYFLRKAIECDLYFKIDAIRIHFVKYLAFFLLSSISVVQTPKVSLTIFMRNAGEQKWISNLFQEDFR